METPSNLAKMCKSYNDFMAQHEKTGITIRKFAELNKGKYYAHSHMSRIVRACVELRYAKHEHNKARYEFVLKHMQPIHAKKVLDKMSELYSVNNAKRNTLKKSQNTIIKKSKKILRPDTVSKNKIIEECYVISIFSIPFIKITKTTKN